jgi:hypothetical protein
MSMLPGTGGRGLSARDVESTVTMDVAAATLDRMQSLVQAWEARGDRRCIFLGCYALMTANMLQAVDRSRFRDGPWVSRLLHRFAAYYFDALEQYEQDRPGIPAVWKQTHDAARNGGIKTLQHLFLGVNAHINFDLVFTLVDVLTPEWSGLSEAGRRTRQDDHSLVNTIIAETIDAVQDEVVERHTRWLDIVDRGLGRLDEWLVSQLIAQWRSDVWVNATRVLEAAHPQQRDALRDDIERAVLRRGREILGDLPN